MRRQFSVCALSYIFDSEQQLSAIIMNSTQIHTNQLRFSLIATERMMICTIRKILISSEIQFPDLADSCIETIDEGLYLLCFPPSKDNKDYPASTGPDLSRFTELSTNSKWIWEHFVSWLGCSKLIVRLPQTSELSRPRFLLPRQEKIVNFSLNLPLF